MGFSKVFERFFYGIWLHAFWSTIAKYCEARDIYRFCETSSGNSKHLKSVVKNSDEFFVMLCTNFRSFFPNIQIDVLSINRIPVLLIQKKESCSLTSNCSKVVTLSCLITCVRRSSINWFFKAVLPIFFPPLKNSREIIHFGRKFCCVEMPGFGSFWDGFVVKVSFL